MLREGRKYNRKRSGLREREVMSVVRNQVAAQSHVNNRWISHLEGFIQNVGHLILKVLRRSKGTCE